MKTSISNSKKFKIVIGLCFNAKLAVFSTSPAIRDKPKNLIAEIIGTFVLVLLEARPKVPKLSKQLKAMTVGILSLLTLVCVNTAVG